MTDAERADSALREIEGKRLTYRWINKMQAKKAVSMTAPAYPRSEKDKIQSYMFVMEEVRARLEVLNTITKDSNLHPGLVVEICYLQFRHIVELVAIACLLAHGDFKTYKSFEKSYSPVEVFKRLDNIWPHFFPQPITKSIKDGKSHQIEANSKPNAITRKEMEHLWEISGDKLHRLSISKFFKRRHSVSNDTMEEIKSMTSRIVDLLSEHIITLSSPKRIIVVSLYQPDCRVSVQSIIYGVNNTMQIEAFKLE